MRTSGPAFPPIPKADETHRLGYRIEGSGAIELEGVCGFSETEVACWDAKGADLPNLKSQIESALRSDNGGYSPLNLRFGKKNRIVVVRSEQAVTSNRDGMRKSLNIQNIGADPRVYSGSINLPSESPDPQTGKPFVNHDARVVALGSDDKETQMRIMVAEPIPDAPEIALLKGASVKFAGCHFEVVAVEKGAPPDGFYRAPGSGPVWTVRLRQTGKPARPASFNVQGPMDRYQDAKGKLVDGTVYRKWMEETMRKGGFDPSKAPYRPIQVSGHGVTPDGTMTVVASADPALIGKARIVGSYQRFVDVTGIPLDPGTR